jgi:hypothetical protein
MRGGSEVAHYLNLGTLPFGGRSSSKEYFRFQSVPKRTQHFTITKISCFLLFREIIVFYSQNQSKPIDQNKLCEQNSELLNVK